jgi:hypothetical protein
VLLLLTIGLVLVGAVALVIGFVSQNTVPIYISIACSVGAGLVLLIFSRMNRRQGVPATAAVGGASTGPATTEYVLEEARAAARPSAASAAASDDGFPIEDYDQLLVSEIVPLLPELDIEELDQVRAREEDGKARASILRRIDALAADLESGGATVATAVIEPEDEDEEEDYEVEEDEEEEPEAEAYDDDLFPIAEYDELRVNQILPLLPELDDDELAVVAEREREGAGRYSILARIDELLGVTVTPVKKAPVKKKPAAKKAPAAKKPAAKKATAAKKTTAKKAPAKKATTTKKTTAKKAPAKKAAAKKAR